ncbi:hypothetical protein CYMTET_33870, partial [Cymbomonas tetramitiformis]
ALLASFNMANSKEASASLRRATNAASAVAAFAAANKGGLHTPSPKQAASAGVAKKAGGIQFSSAEGSMHLDSKVHKLDDEDELLLCISRLLRGFTEIDTCVPYAAAPSTSFTMANNGGLGRSRSAVKAVMASCLLGGAGRGWQKF